MPIYEYECLDHGVFEHFRPMTQSREPAPCTQCGAESGRILSAPRVSQVAATQRIALDRNERSRHEPHVCSRRHSAGTQRSAEPPRARRYGGARPWVIEHG
jgi:putative FmdB family regulatory protein